MPITRPEGQMSRAYKINRNSSWASSERVDWLDALADDINNASKRTAVQVGRYRNQLSLYDQISSIVTNQTAAHQTVEGIVQEMHERVGLKGYLDTVANNEKANKVAQKNERPFDRLDSDTQDNLTNFCKNKISTHRGQTSVPAVQHDLLSVFKNSGIRPEDINNECVARFISNLIAEEQGLNPTIDSNNVEIGKGVGVVDMEADDSDNTDFMKGLMPATD